MFTETAKMIFPEAAVAHQIADTLSKEDKYTVIKVTTGFQVCKVNKCQSAMPPWPPLPFKKMIEGEKPATVTSPHSSVKLTTIALPLLSETPKYLEVQVAGKTTWLGKSTIFSWSVTGDTVRIRLDWKIVKRRKLEDYIVEDAA